MRTVRRSFLLLAALLSALPPSVQAKSKGEYWMYIGTYTRQNSKGIYVYRFDPASGKATPAGLAAETSNPSFLTVHPNRRFLYAVNEIGNYNGQRAGSASAFAIDRKTGRLTHLNTVSSRGGGPCHLSVDKTGKNLLVANYGGGSIAVLPIGADGRLGEATTFIQHEGSGADPKRQQGPHAHSIHPARGNRFVIATDLGLDQVLSYRFDAAKGLLTPNQPPFTKLAPGAGPRHFAFHPAGRFAYVINEMKSTVTALAYDAARGSFQELQTVTTLPQDFQGENNTAEVQVHPSGKFLYGSNRGHDSIAIFAIDAAKGTLTPIDRVSTQGKTPRNFGIDPTGAWLLAANMGSDNIVAFRIDLATGRLTPTGQVLEAGSPVCVKFVPMK
ncbi:MAG: lactonase family protein [Acidobacteria bacterium]|nr:lactonase family protein [Acidobacteriota bacterium]